MKIVTNIRKKVWNWYLLKLCQLNKFMLEMLKYDGFNIKIINIMSLFSHQELEICLYTNVARIRHK